MQCFSNIDENNFSRENDSGEKMETNVKTKLFKISLTREDKRQGEVFNNLIHISLWQGIEFDFKTPTFFNIF